MDVFWRCEPPLTTMFLKALSTPTFVEISPLRGLSVWEKTGCCGCCDGDRRREQSYWSTHRGAVSRKILPSTFLNQNLERTHWRGALSLEAEIRPGGNHMQDGTDASYPRNYHGVYLLSETVSRGDSRLRIPKNAVADVMDVEGSAYGGFIWGISRQPSEPGTVSLRCDVDIRIVLYLHPCQAPPSVRAR